MVLCNLLGHETMTTALAPPSAFPTSCAATPATIIPIKAAQGLRLRVTQALDIAAGIRLFEFAAADHTALPPVVPGAHIRLSLPNGIERSYSLCNAPGQSGYRIAVKREAASRGGSAWLHDHLQVGDVLYTTPPANAFALRPSSIAPALFAAGIGITPLYAMAAELAAQARPVHLHYFVRGLQHAAFIGELDALSTGMSLHLGLDGEGSARAVRAALQGLDRTTPLYICGPHPFIDTVRNSAAALGWQSADVNFELFAAANVPTPSSQAAQGFELVLQRSGVRCQVAPGQSIVAAAAQVGVRIGTSCGEGFCGSCEASVLEGQPEHRDSVLSERERASGKTILPCVSRCAGTRLVLDL